MRSANAICIIAFIVVVAAATFTTTQAQGVPAAATYPTSTNPPPPASPTDLEFLRGRCTPGVMPKPIAERCYNTLLPQAGSFHNSCIKVIDAAAEIMVANFRSFFAELQHVKATSPGIGYTLGKCASQAAEYAEPGKKVPETLTKIRDLAAMGDDNKVESVTDLLGWINGVDDGFEDCLTEMTSIPDADKLLPTKKAMYPSILVTQGLISGYNPPKTQI